MPEHKLYLTMREASMRLGVHPNTLRNWEQAGRIHMVRLPGSQHRRVPVSEVRRLLEHIQGQPAAGVRLELPSADPSLRAEGEALAAAIKQEIADARREGTLEECLASLRGRSWSS
ncbi:MAG: helix-turn-helix domain-containing protein [Anaerolineae bacterium]